MKRLLLGISFFFVTFLHAATVQADAQADLAAGQAALNDADLDKALPLLKSAAEGLPQSVEAQLALAEVQLRLGNINDARAQFAAVLKLSPNHTHARRVHDSLTRNKSSFDTQIAAAKALMTIHRFDQANDLLSRLTFAPGDVEQKNIVRLLTTECWLWNRSSKTAISNALQIVAQDPDKGRAAQARVIAALAWIKEGRPTVAQIDELLDEAGDVAEPWKSHIAAARALIRVGKENTAETSASLLAINSIPRGDYRASAINRASQLMTTVRELTDQGKTNEALQVLWPMISSEKLPEGNIALKPVDLSNGWLMTREADQNYRKLLVDLLTGLSYAEFQRDPNTTTFGGHWLAVEVMRQSPVKIDVATTVLPTIAHLGPFSHLAKTWKKGEVLSNADRLQRELIVQMSREPMNDATQKKLVEVTVAQIQRYQQVSDAKTGLAQFATIDEDGVKLAGALNELRSVGARNQLLTHIATVCSQIGEADFSKSQSAVVKNANIVVNQYDKSAITLLAELQSRAKGDNSFSQSADAIVNRYINAGHWDAAIDATAALHDGDATQRRWSSLRLRIRQANAVEDKLLAARRALGDELPALVKSSLAEAAAIVQEDSRERNRQIAMFVGDGLISRYFRLNRPDLSELVIATLAADEDGELNDWSLWAKASLLDQQAGQALAKVVGQSDDRSAITLHDLHKAEIEQLTAILANHPTSRFAGKVVTRIEEISSNYQTYQAFDTAQAVLADFLKAQPNLAAAERLEYQAINVALAEAQYAFDNRPNQVNAPTELLPGHLDAIDALATFLKAHPTGDFSRQAENNLFGIARLYGNVDAWSVSRTVLDRFTAAIPNFRSPSHLKLLQAATYLGQLDKGHGLALLNPSPTETRQPASPTETALAMTTPSAAGPSLDDNDKGGLDPFGGGAGGGFAGRQPGGDKSKDSGAPPATRQPAFKPQPNLSSLAMIRQSQQQQYKRIAMLELPAQEQKQGRGERSATPALPSGVLISTAEMKRQDDAADKAYAILIELVKSKDAKDAAAGEQARGQIQWVFSFFENQLRADRAIVMIKRYLGDNPTDPERVALGYRSLSDQIVWVRQRKPSELIDQAWIDARHELFQQARKEINEFVAANSDKKQWSGEAQLLLVNSFEQEAELARLISAERAAGLLVQCSDAIQSLLKTTPDHPQAANFPNRIWGLADQIGALGQNQQAIYVLRQLSIKLPTHPMANQSLVKIAQFYATNLTNPLRAVETYQDYLSRTDGDPSVPAQIFEIARQLGEQERYLEAIHVYNVFVDSFPTDARAAAALHAIGKTHQANEVWTEAIATYDRINEEYSGNALLPQVKLDIAECRINLGEWSEARRLYEDFLAKFPQHGQIAMARSRLDVLKKLDRFQDLLADDQIDRNKDDAQFQIGRTVQLELQNPVKAIEEFRKVVAKYGKSDVADDAQIEIGRALLTLGRLDEGRAELLKVAPTYPNSPLADDALFLVAQSYEQFAQQLAGVTQEKAYEESFRQGQKLAYARFNKEVSEETERMAQRRVQLKAEGNQQQIGLNDALDASRSGNLVAGKLFCHVTQAELEAETETALQIANRQDRINDAYREAIEMYVKAATDHPLGDKTDQSLIRIAEIFETRLKDRAAAMQTYQKIVKQFPGTPVAEDAAWKVTQFHVEEGKYAAAADSYKTFIRNYPGSPRVADAQFGLAEVLEQLGKWVDAMDAYEIFRQKFNKHPKVKLATDQISWIKTYRK